MFEYDLCKENSICCDDNCQRCAQLIFQKYMSQTTEIKNLKEQINSLKEEIVNLRRQRNALL